MKRCRHCDRAPYHCGRCILERFEAAIEALDAREAIRLEKRKKSDFKYRTRPENQERRRAYNREYQRQRRQNPEVREREKRQQLEYSQRPEAREVRGPTGSVRRCGNAKTGSSVNATRGNVVRRNGWKKPHRNKAPHDGEEGGKR